METLIYNSTSFLRLAFGQYFKAFSLSATPVAYYSPVLIRYFIAMDSRALSVLKHYEDWFIPNLPPFNL